MLESRHDPAALRALRVCLRVSLLVFTATASAAPPPGPISPPDLVVERFGSDRGLSIDNVTAIHQDRAGFLWIGTREGLVMYDGHSSKTFEHDISDPRSISDNYVRTVYEDKAGNLWIGTNSSGLNRLDRASWTFEHYRHDSADPRTISHDSVNLLLEDPSGTLWVGTQIGLNRFDPASGTFERFLADPADPGSLSHDYIYALCRDSNGTLWIGTVGGGLNRWDPETRTFTAYRHDPDDPRSIGSDHVFALIEDGRGRLWVGTDSGLDVLDPDRSSFEHYAHDPDSGAGLSYRIVTSLVIDHEQTLWIGTWGGGADRLDTRTGEFLSSASIAAPALESERIAALAVDHTGAIWLGTWAQGALRARRPAVRAWMLTEAHGLTFRDATAVYEAESGRLWVGTWGRGLELRQPARTTFDESFRRTLVSLDQGTILAIHDAGDDGVWVGSMGPLFRVLASGGTRVYAHDTADPHSLGPGYVTSVFRDSDGHVWTGVGGSGLYRMRPDGNGFDAFVHDPGDEGTLSDDYITDLVEDHQGMLWVGTRSGGVNVLDRSTGRAARYLPDPSDPHSLSYHYITSMAVDDQDTVWIATAGGGLNAARKERREVRFERYTESDGLIDDTIRSLAIDGDTLWLATAHGLTRFDTARGKFVSYDSSDGLPTSGFNADASCTGAEHVYFGSSKGVLVIPRGLPMASPPPAPTVLRSVRTLDGTVAAEEPPWDLDILEVPYGEILSFGFAVLDFGDTRRHRFAYRLSGLRSEWIDIDDRREITFTGLAPGDYTLEVRGRSSHGVWSDGTASLRLGIVPPFWMTTWFRLSVVGLLVVAFFLAHKRRTSKLKRRNRELLALKDEREAALAETRQGREQLHDTYAQLRRLTRRLEAAKEDERKRIARELHDEMGQGLTAAKINLQLLASISSSRESADRASDTVELVDHMIQHVRTLSLDLRPPLLDELGLGPALRSYLEAQAQRTGLEIVTTSDGLPADLPAEIGITVFRFVQEAVTNVVRHAEARHIAVTIEERADHLEIAVSDDGRGFDVHEALARAAGGAHLGLLGIRERVETLGGELRIDSSKDDGTTLTVRVPWR
jgi:signal transduction histidine kinase/ligand-binding sensor domain-containing protein